MLRTLLSGLPVIQVAVVVHDLEACAARQRANLGNGAWRVYDLGPHVIDRYLLRGEPATGHTLVALNDKHPQTEILQPLGGTSLHQEVAGRAGRGPASRRGGGRLGRRRRLPGGRRKFLPSRCRIREGLFV